MLAVIVIPSSSGPEASMIGNFLGNAAAKINDMQSSDKQWLSIINTMYNSTIELESIKWYFKAVLITIYIAFVAYIVTVKLKIFNRKKLKRF